MSTTTKVFVSASLGSFVATWAGPKIMPKLPESLRTGNVAKATTAFIAGASAALTYYGLTKVGVVGA